MTPAQKTMLKKKREQMRKRLRYDIQNLIKLSEGELGEFEATHAVVDSILNGLDERIRYGQVKPTLELGIAQTYTEHTKHQAGQAGATEPAQPHAVKNVWSKLLGKGSLYPDPAPIFIDDPYPSASPSIEKATAMITKNLQDWAPGKTTMDFIVGGSVAASTIEHYGYVLQDGYDFIGPNSWGEYVVTKLTPEPATDVPDKQVVHLCGTKGCEQFTVYKGTQYLLSGSMMHAKGLTHSSITQTLEGLQGAHLKAVKVPMKDAVEIGYKVDLDAHLAEYKAKKSADFAKTYGFKTTNYFQQAAKASIKEALNAPNPIWQSVQESSSSITEADLIKAKAKVEAGTFNKHDPAHYPVTNSAGFTSEVPFKTWLPMEALKHLQVDSISLPPGLMWHSHYETGPDKYDPDKSQWYLDYMGSPKPTPPVKPLTAKLPEWTWNYGDQVQEFGDSF